MMSNCSLYRLRLLDPAIDPAYQDGPPPREHRVSHAGEIVIAKVKARNTRASVAPRCRNNARKRWPTLTNGARRVPNSKNWLECCRTLQIRCGSERNCAWRNARCSSNFL